MPTRLLDVSNGGVRLVETSAELSDAADRRYVALSHCWGNIHIIRTVKDRYKQHLSAIDTANLSKTFEDAVHATRQLGFRYQVSLTHDDATA